MKRHLSFRIVVFAISALWYLQGISIFAAVRHITDNTKLNPPSIIPAHFGWELDANNGKVLIGGFDQYSYIYDIASGQELLRLRGNDTSPDDLFGRSVALSDNYALVGANQAQAAYIFNANTGQQIRKFTDPNAASGGLGFGWSVALSGDIAVIGDVSDGTKATEAGAAYVYRISTGQLIRTLLTTAPSPILDHFGAAVDIQGDTIVVGAPDANAGGFNAGAAYVYSASTGNLLHTLAPDSTGRGFGSEVVIADDMVMVGKSSLSSHGAAYLFDMNTGNLLRKFTSPHPLNDALFGESIAFDGERALIGSWGEYHKGSYWVGSAYLFDVATGELLASWLPSELGVSSDEFGYSVAMDGNTLLAMGRDSVYFAPAVPEPNSLIGFSTIILGGVAAFRRVQGRHEPSVLSQLGPLP